MVIKPIYILILQLIVLGVQLFLYIPQFSAGLVSGCEGCDRDAIQVAAQLGRLDVVSLLLAMLGIGLVVIGFLAFFSIKAQAEAIARSVATKVAMDEAARVTDLWRTAYNNPEIGAGSGLQDVNTDRSKAVSDDNDQ